MTLTSLSRKVIRDIWHERARTALVVLSMAIGLTGFLAVLSTSAILRRELNLGYLATNPASAVLSTDAIDERLLSAVIARDDVEDADARAVLNGRIQVAAGSWRRLVLFVIRDFTRLRISTIAPEAGGWPPRAGDMLIERDAFQVAQTHIGATVIVQMDGREHALHVAGRVHDPGQAQARMENLVYGYITPQTLATFDRSIVLDRLYLAVSGDRLAEPHVRRVADDVKEWLERNGHPVRRASVPVPGQHPHAAIMGLLLLLMAAFGLFVLTLSGVIVVNLFLAMMAAERRQIGAMKAVGGSRGQIARIYLTEAAVSGLAAFAVAMPAGIVGGRLLSRYVAVLLNFDLASLAVPAWIDALVVLVAVVVPVAAAAYPVAIGTDVPVCEAIAPSGGVPARFGQGRFDRLVGRFNAAGRPWLLGIRNSLRRRTRTALTLMTFSAAGTFFISALNVRTSLIAAGDRRFGPGTAADVRYAFDQHMLMIYVFLLIVAGVLAAVGGLGLATTTSLNMRDRRRELGVLRAIGATPRAVAGIVVVEAVFIGVLAWAVATLFAWELTRVVNAFVPNAGPFRGGIGMSISAWGIAGWLALSAAIAVASSIAPAIAASRRSIREAISYE